MNKNRNNNKSKKSRVKPKSSGGIVKVHGRVANLLDHVKQLLFYKGLDYETIYQQMREKVSLSELEKLGQNLKRCLVNNISFYHRNNTWYLDEKGNPHDNPFYQYLTTLGRPTTFRELMALAEENNLKDIKITEQDFAYDGRFIRLKNGKWALTHWQILWEVSKEELNQVVSLLQKKEEPLTAKYLAMEIMGLDVHDTNLGWLLAKDPRFIQIGIGQWYLKNVLDEILTKLHSPDEFAFIREGEINALQEAELMLIIEEADATKRQYILSSLDLERGILRLNKRMAELFKGFPDIAYLKLPLGQERLGIWYFKRENCLAGLKPWYFANKLEAGSKIELQLPKTKGFIELKVSGAREVEVFAEGLKMKKLVNLKERGKVSLLDPEETVTEILQLYPEGLDFKTLSILMDLILKIGEKELASILKGNVYFEKDKEENWRCNMIVRQAYQNWLKEKEELKRQLNHFHQEVAVTVEDFDNLHQINVNLEEELAYLREHHREEEAFFQSKIEELAATNEHLTAENNRLRSEYTNFENKQKELLDHLEYQGNQLVNLRNERNKYKVRAEQVEGRAMQLQSNLNHLKEEAQIEIDRLRREVLEKDHQLDSLQYANQELQRNLARLHEERRQLRRQFSSWPVKIALFFSGLRGGSRKSVGG